LYGKRKDQPPDLCSESSFDAIFEDPDGIIYVLKGKGIKIYGTQINNSKGVTLLLLVDNTDTYFVASVRCPH
jgi:hypothetical protein